MAESRYLFVGGPLARGFSLACRQAYAGDETRLIHFLRPEALVRATGRELAARATCVVFEQSEDAAPDPPGLSAGANLIRYPRVLADFLWPYAGREHRLTSGRYAIQGGPYPPEQGDSFLDAALEAELPEDEAIARYLALDIAAEARLDALFEARREAAARLDRALGYGVVPLLDRFRDERLFQSLSRPAGRLLDHLGETLFGALGIAWPVRGARLFPEDFTPIHPGIIRHFGLRFVTPDSTYTLLDEGEFDFETFCRRYLRFEWNEDLHEGLRLAAKSPEYAIPLLEEALRRSPGSIAAREALAEARRAVQAGTEPDAAGASPMEAEPAPGKPHAHTPDAAPPPEEAELAPASLDHGEPATAAPAPASSVRPEAETDLGPADLAPVNPALPPEPAEPKRSGLLGWLRKR